MTDPIPPDHVLTEAERAHCQELADRSGEVLTATDTTGPSVFYPRHPAQEKEAD